MPLHSNRRGNRARASAASGRRRLRRQNSPCTQARPDSPRRSHGVPKTRKPEGGLDAAPALTCSAPAAHLQRTCALTAPPTGACQPRVPAPPPHTWARSRGTGAPSPACHWGLGDFPPGSRAGGGVLPQPAGPPPRRPATANHRPAAPLPRPCDSASQAARTRPPGALAGAGVPPGGLVTS